MAIPSHRRYRSRLGQNTHSQDHQTIQTNLHFLPHIPWSSVRARQCLDFLKNLVSHSLVRKIPGRSPKHGLFHIQQCIEHAYGCSEEMAGSTINLVKCFNTLPRNVLQDIASHAGIPDDVMQPRTQALRQMIRLFKSEEQPDDPSLHPRVILKDAD